MLTPIYIQEMPSKSPNTETAGSTQQTHVQQLVISPNDGLEYRVAVEGLKDFLPVLPLTGPIHCQVEFPTDFCPGKDETATTKPKKPSSQFLPLLEPVPTAAHPPGRMDLGNGQSTKTEPSNTDLGNGESTKTKPGNTGLGNDKSTQTEFGNTELGNDKWIGMRLHVRTSKIKRA